MSSRRFRGLSDERGSILPLIIGYACIAILLVLIATAATSLYLERKRLFALADGASLAGAEAFDIAAVSPGPSGPRPLLRAEDVAAAVSEYLTQARTAEFEALAVERAVSVDGETATVELSAYWRPPVLTLFVPEGVRVDVTSTARSVFD